ncbi:hypothetical protein [Xanthocytophaga agilis]|uniref:Uncharacterized protein n=1 Tax=Xanthocytophaga agilis TaxID=3048010 RepID=A0AAE3UEC7_9BACT|nr:hypothetical protein [Xanthocytophaga agilis]MDJ1502095.1 hypothetical protein [Xanthocytophaga agilis]
MGKHVSVQDLKQIDWSTLSHAYDDSAEDVAYNLEILLTLSSGEEVFEQALSELYNSLSHQGTIYDSTAAAIPFLIAALDHCPSSCKPTLVRLLGSISEGMVYRAQHEDVYTRFDAQLAWVNDGIEALWKGFDSLTFLLTDPIKEVRIQAPYLVTNLLSKSEDFRPVAYRNKSLDMAFALRISQELLPTEPDSFVRCSFVYSLGHTAFNYPDSLEILRQLLQQTGDARVRICTALNLAMHQQYEDALEPLTTTLQNCAITDRLFFNELPWFSGWLRFQLVYSLSSFPFGYLDQILPAFLQSIKAASANTTEIEISPILRYVFQGRKVDLSKGLAELSVPERTILRAIYANSAILGTPIGNVGLTLRNSIGLEDKKDVWKQLLGL